MFKRIFTIILFLPLLTGCSAENSEKTQWGSFTSESTCSYDGAYIAKQEVVWDELLQMEYIQVKILDANDNREVYRFEPARARDFWGICWEDDSYNIWVQSGDIGVVCYKDDDGIWILDETAQRPDYISSKYD